MYFPVFWRLGRCQHDWAVMRALWVCSLPAPPCVFTWWKEQGILPDFSFITNPICGLHPHDLIIFQRPPFLKHHLVYSVCTIWTWAIYYIQSVEVVLIQSSIIPFPQPSWWCWGEGQLPSGPLHLQRHQRLAHLRGDTPVTLVTSEAWSKGACFHPYLAWVLMSTLLSHPPVVSSYCWELTGIDFPHSPSNLWPTQAWSITLSQS